MASVEPSGRTGRKRWAAFLACGPLALIGCGGSNEPAPAATAAATPAAPEAGHDAAPGGHGEPAGHGAPDAGHGESSDIPGDPASGHGDASSAHDAPDAGHGSPDAAHGDPAGGHGSPDSAHGGPEAGHGSPDAAHGDPAGGHGAAGQTAGDQQPSTAGWLGSLLGLGGQPPQPPGPPGVPMPAAGPDGAHGDAAEYAPPGEPGAESSGVPTEGSQAAQFAPGTAEYAIQQVALKLAAGDQTGLDVFISDKARGNLAKFRTGEADPVDVAEAKQAMAGVQPVTMRDASGGKSIILRNTAGQMITFTAKREEGGYKVTGMKIDAARGRGR